jgi:hypothetical protein
MGVLFGGEKYCQVTAGEDENNPNWGRYKAHFTYLDSTHAKYHSPFCGTSLCTIILILTLSHN